MNLMGVIFEVVLPRLFLLTKAANKEHLKSTQKFNEPE